MLNKKLDLIVANCAFVIGIIGVRVQSPGLLGGSLIVLSTLYYLNASTYHLGGIVLLLVLMAPINSSGWLYGIDSHTAAAQSKAIMGGWPLTGSNLGGVGTGYPILYFLASIVSIITGAGLIPETSNQLLTSQLLPIIFVFLAVSVAAFYSKRLISESSLSISNGGIIIAPILCWTPMFIFHTVFQRRSLSILLLVSTSALLMRYHKSIDRRYLPLLIVLIISTILTNHLSGFLLLLLVGSQFAHIVVKHWDNLRNNLMRYSLILLITLLIHQLWSTFAGYGGEYTLVGFFQLRLIETQEILASLGLAPKLHSAVFPNQSSPSSLVYFREFIARWLFQVLLAIGISASCIYSIRRDKDDYRIHIFYLGILVATSGVAAVIINRVPSITIFEINPMRVFTVFVLVAGGVAMHGYVVLDRILPSRQIFTRTAILLFIVLGVIMVPPHYISSTPPDYQSGSLDPRIGPRLHSLSDFTEEYGEYNQLIGDVIVRAAIQPKTGQEVNGHHDEIRSGTISSNSAIVLTAQNRYVYSARYQKSGNQFITINPYNIFNKFNKHNRIYDNGDNYVYTK
ncbi:hypothetical protein SAMN05192561_10230 [Halopenitus malekzadehii]|uniref:Dolichyl-phosphate-mannose-protein mannosyltransferase n=1 Tax=Halopenitus malekzadehii TaxID=1267564 RepID=A0A1H6IEW7_9EURY|nr:hypothetical protein [Halopenitus malekzadehii]SEH45469.1 hypothetical protein SAMN05192561_10230 [Halopenitus malekzadehii]